MARSFEALKAGWSAAAESFGPKRHALEGRRIVCPHCRHDEFAASQAQLNTAGLTFFNLDWANGSATTLARAECGRLEWLLQEPQSID